MGPALSAPLLEARGIWKSFGAVQALSDVDFEIGPHECVALVGDNGAGKSTLIRIMCGAHQPSKGELYLNGEEVRFAGPRDAQAVGISVVHQDLALVEGLDVATNVFLGHVPTRRFRVDRKRMARETRDVLNQLAIDIPSVRSTVRLLSGGQRQAVAITRAVHHGGRLMIMDEPTAALGVQEQRKVLQLIGTLKERGIAVLVVSHNLEHVFSIADRIAVMRGGRLVGVRTHAETSPKEVVELITGAAALAAASSGGS